jgi:hypothetical protein
MFRAGIKQSYLTLLLETKQLGIIQKVSQIEYATVPVSYLSADLARWAAEIYCLRVDNVMYATQTWVHNIRQRTEYNADAAELGLAP